MLRFRKTRRTAGLLGALATVVLALSVSALAAWSQGGSGSAAGGAGTMPAGGTPAARASVDGFVVVTWPAETLSNGEPVDGYTVQRYDVASGAGTTVGAACSGIVTGTTCTERGVGPGTWVYTDTPVLANWSGAPSALSNAVTIGGATTPTTASTPTTATTTTATTTTTTATTTTTTTTAAPPLASPTLTVSAPASGAVGTAIPASALGATLAASSGASASGTIAFTVFGPSASAPSTCNAAGTSLGGAPVSGNGGYVAAEGFTPTQAGNYWLYAAYGGDGANDPAQSPCPPSAEIIVT
jgi:hypothetical protein